MFGESPSWTRVPTEESMRNGGGRRREELPVLPSQKAVVLWTADVTYDEADNVYPHLTHPTDSAHLTNGTLHKTNIFA